MTDVYVDSNIEAVGDGRSDVIIHFVSPPETWLIIEFKRAKTDEEAKDLEELARVLMKQIREKRYHLKKRGRVYLIGAAFHGK
jgi:hypothetical protein